MFSFTKKNMCYWQKIVSLIILMSLIFNLPGPAHSQLDAGLSSTVGVLNTVTVYQAPHLSGLNIHPENPFLFDFIVNPGAQKVQGEALKSESERLVKYFLTAMTLPDKEAWVNLSPYEANRIIPDTLGHTEMGKIMLEQDYQLKQLAASLTNPDTDLGRKYWHAMNHERIAVSDAQASMSKVWVVPGQAEVVEQDGKVFVTGNRLKVMLEEDYAALSQNKNNLTSDDQAQNAKATAIFRQLILPQLEKEVNEGKTFAPIRQIYNSAILAVWYKQSLKESLLGKIYVNQQKIKGVEINDISFKNNVYQQYLEAFKKGAYHLIKEEEQDGEVVPRKYFSGGAEVIPSQVIITHGAVGSSGISEQDVAVTVQLDAETPAAKIVGNRAKSIEPTAMTFKPVLKTSASSTIAEAKAKFFAEVRATFPAKLGSELAAVSSLAQTFYKENSESVRKNWREVATMKVSQVLLWAMIEAYRMDDQDNRELAKQNARKVFTGNYKDEDIENMAEWIVRFEKWQRDPQNDELLMDVISLFNSQSMKKVNGFFIRFGVPKGNPFAKSEAWQLAVQGAAMQFFFETGHISWLLRTMLIEDIHHWIAFRELRPAQMSPGAYYMSEIIDEMIKMGMTSQPDVALPAYSAEFSFADHGSISMKEVQKLSNQARRLGVSEEGKFFRFGLMSALKDQVTEQLKEQFPRLFGDENFERFYIAIDSQTGALAIAFRQPGVGLSFESRMLLVSLGDLPLNPQDIQSINLMMTQYGAEIKPEHKAAIEAAVSRVLFRLVVQPNVKFTKVEPSSASSGVKDVRLGVADQPTAKPGEPDRQSYGGIDFDPTLMNLQIKRDPKGVPLPLPQQNLENIHIDGVYPIIINIQPAVPANYPLLVKKS